MQTDTPKSERFLPGFRIAGKYTVLRTIGEGGMGTVYEAEHDALREKVAIKVLHKKRAGDPEIAVRFVREARTAVRIKSDAIARVTDVGTTEEGLPYIVMERLEGEDLGALIDREGALTVEQAVDFLLQACEGVAAAHAVGIVHRDLKPSNLFVAEDAAGELRIKVLDFGISKVFEPGPEPERAVTTTSDVLGSPGYMAPEQMRASRDVDGRTDVWALSMILWESLAGVPMFAKKTFPEICAQVLGGHFLPLSALGVTAPPELEAAVMKGLELDPEARFPSVADLAAAIAPFGSPGSLARVARIQNLARAPSDRQKKTPSTRPPAPLSPTVPALPSFRMPTEGAVAKDTQRTTQPDRKKRTTRGLAIVSGGALLIAGVVGVVLMNTKGDPAPAAAPTSASAPAPVTPAPPSASASAPPALAPASAHASASAPAPASAPLPAPSLRRPPPPASASAAPTVKPANGAPILH